MNKFIAEFIQKHKQLILDNNFSDLYELAHKELYFSDKIGQLTHILLSSGIDPIKQGQLSSVPADYLYMNDNLTEFIVPSNVTKIENSAFQGCQYLRQVNLTNVQEIEYSAFNRCYSLMHIDLPEGLKTIGDYSFSGTGITNVIIPKSATLIRSNAFDSHVEYLVYKDSPMAKIAAAEAIHPYRFID